MREISLHKSKITIGGSIDDSFRQIDDDCFFLTDTNLFRNYMQCFPKGKVFLLHPGEESKTIEVVGGIISKMLERGVNRSSKLIGVGGGVVTDITGFIASIYMRGIGFEFFPTSLLAMADAAIGGKNGVNFGEYKNIIGTINQPSKVRIIPEFLNTLPEREMKSGMAEIIKSAIISGEDFFGKIESYIENAGFENNEALEELITRAVELKCSIVEIDQFENGERKKLNLGHTLAHAIENQLKLSHGEAVSVGIMLSAKVSHKLRILEKPVMDRIESLLRKFALPVEIDYSRIDLENFISKDKKSSGETIDYVVIKDIGAVEIMNLPVELLVKMVREK